MNNKNTGQSKNGRLYTRIKRHTKREAKSCGQSLGGYRNDQAKLRGFSGWHDLEQVLQKNTSDRRLMLWDVKILFGFGPGATSTDQHLIDFIERQARYRLRRVISDPAILDSYAAHDIRYLGACADPEDSSRGELYHVAFDFLFTSSLPGAKPYCYLVNSDFNVVPKGLSWDHWHGQDVSLLMIEVDLENRPVAKVIPGTCTREYFWASSTKDIGHLRSREFCLHSNSFISGTKESMYHCDTVDEAVLLITGEGASDPSEDPYVVFSLPAVKVAELRDRFKVKAKPERPVYDQDRTLENPDKAISNLFTATAVKSANTDTDLKEVYQSLDLGDGEPVYLCDGVYLTSEGKSF